jgi:hypothetical protein
MMLPTLEATMNASKRRNAAIYVRVSTDGQTVENQTRELRQIAERRGWQVVEIYSALAGPRDAINAPAWTGCSKTPANAGSMS